MAREEVFTDQERYYKLYRVDGRHWVYVLCGGSGMFDVEVPLTEEEEASYEQQGKRFLDNLCYKICKDPEQYKNRK